MAIEETVADRNGQFTLVMQTRENLEDERTADEFTDEQSSLMKWVNL